MPSVRELVTQSGADTETRVSFATGLTADGKALWQINGIEAYWKDGAAVAAADWSLTAYLETSATAFDPANIDVIDSLAWGLQNTGGVAVAVPYEPQKAHMLIEPRLTAQPTLYVGVASAGTSQANDVVIVVYYEVVKATDNEVLRMLVGGA